MSQATETVERSFAPLEGAKSFGCSIRRKRSTAIGNLSFDLVKAGQRRHVADLAELIELHCYGTRVMVLDTSIPSVRLTS